jgi:hypothetical protein
MIDRSRPGGGASLVRHADASRLFGSRERSEYGLPSEMMEATFVYARDLADHVAKIVEAHQFSLPLEVIAASRRIGKELDWIEQDLLLQRQLWQAKQALHRGASRAA